MKQKKAGPAYTIKVTEEEREQAKVMRRAFEMFLREQGKLEDYLLTFFEAYEALQDKNELVKISPQVTRYIHGMKVRFKEYMDSFAKALTECENGVSSTKLDNIRDLIIENVKHIRDEAITLVSILKDLESRDLYQDSAVCFATIVSLMERAEGIIINEWFEHIDYDILGRIRLG